MFFYDNERIFGQVSIDTVNRHLPSQWRQGRKRLESQQRVGTLVELPQVLRDLRNRARFDVARTLVAGTGMTVTDLALALGYADASAFTHAFCRWVRTAPSQWQQQLETA
ncbi:MAG: helix-turn-helix domain-containing protein [Acetobacteraceae bacterium]